MQTLRDSSNRVIAFIEDQSDQQFIRESSGVVLGRYNKANNTTYDKHNNRIGTGNLLTSLIR